MEIINYKCPNCAAPMTFSIEAQQWSCHFCDSQFTKDELFKISQSEGKDSPEQSTWTAQVFGDEDLISYSCPDCGGRVLAEQNTISTFCTFCHNPNVIASKLTGIYKPAKLIPFKINKEQALDMLRQLVRRRPFLPKEFKDYIEKGEISGLYVPYWLYSADMVGRMTAEGIVINSWSDDRYRYTKTDIYAILREGEVPFRLVPADASSRLDDSLMDSIEPFHYDALQDFTMEYLSGYFAEGFDVSAQDAKHRFVEKATQTLRQMLLSTSVGYSSVRVTSLNTTQKNPDNYYALLPIWTLSITFKSKIYFFAINAQTGKSSGDLPLSWGRVLAWLGGLSVAASAVVGILLYFGGLFS